MKLIIVQISFTLLLVNSSQIDIMSSEPCFQTPSLDAGLEVLTAVAMKITGFTDVLE
jgi:hypothetical protein